MVSGCCYIFAVILMSGHGAYSTYITVSDKIINTTDDRFVSYTIDTAQLFSGSVNLSDSQFIYLTSQWPSYLRVGGTTADYVYYEVANENPCNLPTNQSRPYHCLSMQHVQQLIDFSAQTDSKLVFGLSFGYPTYPNASTKYWNSTNTEAFLKYLHNKGYDSSDIYGFELGNEIAPHDPYYTPQVQSNAFKKLDAIINSIWNNSTTFELFGPDAHSYILRESDKEFSYVPGFVEETCSVLSGVTYHCYVNLNESELLTPDRLNEQYRESIRMSNIWNEATIKNQSSHCKELVHNIWAGEIAEHNQGGLQNVTNTYYDGFWYLDALGTISDLGHAVFARQCMASARYSLIDDRYNPNCDYYTALLFNRLMSNKVVEVKSSDENLRIYAHCGKTGKHSVSMAYINLNAEDTAIQYDSSQLFGDVYIWALTPGNMEQGLESQTMALNGNVLTLINGTLPPMKGKQIVDDSIVVPAVSYGFIAFEATIVSVCQ